MVPNRSEIFLAKAQQGGAVHFGIAANVIMNPRMEGLAILVFPGTGRLVPIVYEDRTRVPIIFFAWQVSVPFQKQDTFTGGGHMMGKCPAACARADDNHVIMVVARHSNTSLDGISHICVMGVSHRRREKGIWWDYSMNSPSQAASIRYSVVGELCVAQVRA